MKTQPDPKTGAAATTREDTAAALFDAQQFDAAAHEYCLARASLSQAQRELDQATANLKRLTAIRDAQLSQVKERIEKALAALGIDPAAAAALLPLPQR